MSFHLTKANQEELLEAAIGPAGVAGWHRDAVAFGARRDGEGEILAVGVFQNFANRTAEFYFASLGTTMTRGMMESYLVLAFHPKMLALERAFVVIPRTNRAALRAAVALGFEFEYRKRSSVTGGDDAIVLSLAP